MARLNAGLLVGATLWATASWFAALAGAANYAWPVVRVVDGDTVAVDASNDFPPDLADLKVRLRGVDTPGERTQGEMRVRARCGPSRDPVH